ncbi:hypothetical protein PVAND_005438 [Polypedilum vanderplanki]|uniref:PDZ domain-containing protein n=1 Tax=Polypedilum vanderplanki TaxID=319348 RepID=A0A9J6C224_POLVA|nr:hypothetical protein PVAND_005438 [Polypedilum vanderplanki]
MLLDAKDFEIKKLEHEDGDSGILINESGASSMVETENKNDKPFSLLTKENDKIPSAYDQKYIQRIEIKYDHNDDAVTHCTETDPKISFYDNSFYNTDEVSSNNIMTEKQRKHSVDMSLNDNINDQKIEKPIKRNSVVSDIVAKLEKNEMTAKYNTLSYSHSPRGALGIFIKNIMPNGQAIESGKLKAGDEILTINGHVCHDLTHQEAVKLFKSVKCGDIVLNICRRKNSAIAL